VVVRKFNNLADLKINMVNRKVDDKNVIVAQLGESLTNEVLERYDESNDGLQNKFHSRFVGLKKKFN
jgi:hypothetical protein